MVAAHRRLSSELDGKMVAGFVPTAAAIDVGVAKTIEKVGEPDRSLPA